MSKRLFVLLFLFLLGAVPASSQWKPWNDLPPHCSHIVVIRGEDDRMRAEGVQFGKAAKLMHPGPRVLAATREALMRMTPLLCQSVGRIAFGRVEARPTVSGAVNSFGSGDLVLINLAYVPPGGKFEVYSEQELEKRLSSRLSLQETLIHEAAHSAETILNIESKDGGPKGYGGVWTQEARSLARRIISKSRLENGLHNEWKRFHSSFVEKRWAARYDNHPLELASVRKELEKPRWANVSANEVVQAGFMNTYGASNWAEDLATFVGNVYIGPEMAAGIRTQENASEELRLDIACRVMQEQTERNVPARLSAVYAKLMFLLDLELVTEDDAEKCTGATFGLPDINSPGFHYFQKGKLLRSFEMNVKAGMGRKGVGNVFEMRAEGKADFGSKTYPASMKLSLAVGIGPIEKASWPRGVYELGIIGPNNLLLALDGAPAGNFQAKDAYVLVASSTNDRISGSIFLTQAWRYQAPLPVPQVFDPPLQIRFQLKK